MNAVLSRCFLALFFLTQLAGCEKEGIQSYTAPRDDDPGTGPYRVLAAIIPVGNDTWFIKLAGRADILEMLEPAYEQILQSLKFPEIKAQEDESLAWKVPSGWEEDRKNPNRVATLTLKGMPRPELTITKLGPMAAAIKPNVDRWRRLDLGLTPISPLALEHVVRERTIAGHKITVIDMRGPGVTVAPRTPPAQKKRPPRRKLPFTFTTPEGWKEGGTSPLVVQSMVISEGDEKAKLTVTPLSKSMPGGLLGNVNRWRGELGLSQLTADDLKNVSMPKIKLGGIEARMIDLEGKTDRSLIVWFERNDETWFYKLRGPTKLIAAQRRNFETFVKSVRFTGGADE